MENNTGKTSLGMQPNAAALLSYLAGFITGIVFFVLEKENKFVRFHALQSVITFGSIFVVQIFLTYVPYLGVHLVPILSLLCLILWILLMYKAYQGETFKLPIVGDIAAQNAGI